MTAPLLALPAHLRQRLVRALEAGMLDAPYSRVGVSMALGADAEAGPICAELETLAQRGISGSAVAYALELAADATVAISRPDLVWSGEEVPGLHARKTRQVFDELIGTAEHSLWICSYTYWDGAKAFEKLATRMDTRPELDVTLLLNIQRKWNDHTPAETLATDFASDLWNKGWPGTRRPHVFYDPRSLKYGADSAVLHAKAVVADDAVAFVTSANLTEKAFDENIEVGMLSRDRAVALSLSKHFRILIERGLLEPLPAM